MQCIFDIFVLFFVVPATVLPSSLHSVQSDYLTTLSRFNLTIGPLDRGPILLVVTFPILDDDIAELDEDFTVQLRIENFPDRVTLGIDSAEIIILDNDGKLYSGLVKICTSIPLLKASITRECHLQSIA